MSDLSAHLLRQVKREPRLAWLIGPGSETWNLLMAEAGITGADRDTLEASLQYQRWPTSLISAVEHLLHGSTVIDRDTRLDLIESVKEAGGRTP